MPNTESKVGHNKMGRISNGVKRQISSNTLVISAIFSLFFVSAIAVPLIVSAQAPAAPGIGSSNPTVTTFPVTSGQNFQLVPCDAPPSIDGQSTTNPVTGAATTPCDFNALISLVQRIINFLLYAAGFIIVLLIVYAGFIYLTAGGDTGKTKKAKDIFKTAIIGFAISLCSWLVVYTIITAVINTAAYPQAATLLGKQ